MQHSLDQHGLKRKMFWPPPSDPGQQKNWTNLQHTASCVCCGEQPICRPEKGRIYEILANLGSLFTVDVIILLYITTDPQSLYFIHKEKIQRKLLAQGKEKQYFY